MKLLRIALGVFLGNLAAQAAYVRAKKIHDLLMRDRHGKKPGAVAVPEDARPP